MPSSTVVLTKLDEI